MFSFLSFFSLVWQKSIGWPPFGGEMSGNVWSCFLCQKPWGAENGWRRGRNRLKGSPAFSIFPSGFIDGVPRAVIGEGSMLVGGFSPPRMRISAGWSSVVAQLPSAVDRWSGANLSKCVFSCCPFWSLVGRVVLLPLLRMVLLRHAPTPQPLINSQLPFCWARYVHDFPSESSRSHAKQ